MDPGKHRERDKRLVQISLQMISDYRDALGSSIVSRLLHVSYLLGQVEKVYIAGNGGSAATAIHFASDLRAAGVQAISLCENISVITRIANDQGYAKVFIRQLQELGLGARDALVLISVSGNSTNIIEAAFFAKNSGTAVIGLIGFAGGRLNILCDYGITLESHDYGLVEGIHSCFCHMIPQLIKDIRSDHGETGNN